MNWEDINGDIIYTLNRVEAQYAGSAEKYTPPREDVMRLFTLFPLAELKIVIIGQDPYPDGMADGLAFSTRSQKVPPSLANIYKCLARSNLIGAAPQHGNLEELAKQGVLLLNSALTTELGKLKAHMSAWTSAINNFLVKLSENCRDCVFMLWGGEAQKKKKFITKNRGHLILEWCHPSPQSTLNNPGDIRGFLYCDHFSRANEFLTKNGKAAINYTVIE